MQTTDISDFLPNRDFMLTNLLLGVTLTHFVLEINVLSLKAFPVLKAQPIFLTERCFHFAQGCSRGILLFVTPLLKLSH